MPTPLYVNIAHPTSVDAVVTGVDDKRVALDRTMFHSTGGGQPHDTGPVRRSGREARVTEVCKQGDQVWHILDGETPTVGMAVRAEIYWDRRHQLMRTPFTCCAA